MHDIVREIASCFAERGNSEYGGENVTQIEHALQCALLAEQADAPTELIVAALLHDIGHLLHNLPNDAPDQGIDDHHENSGYRFLEKHFPQSVSAPVRLHVAAKRYLCTVDPAYKNLLAEPSLVSFRLQGGLMATSELEDFRSMPYWEDALKLRKWDDQAKTFGLMTPALRHYIPLIEQVIVDDSTRQLV